MRELDEAEQKILHDAHMRSVKVVASVMRPKTELGRLVLEARQKYIDGGGKLLSADEINEKIGRR